jgi:hypothetical protein
LVCGGAVAIALAQVSAPTSAPPAATATATTTTAAAAATTSPAPAIAAVTPPSRGLSSSRPSSSSPTRDYRDRYAILSDRNIFVKERSRIVPLSDRDRPRSDNSRTRSDTPRLPPPETSYILTGIVLEDGLVHAYVEDMKGGKILRLSVGDAVARGHITDITIDAVQYTASGQQAWVDLGRDFTGAIPSSPSAIYAAAAAAATQAGGTSTTGPTSAPSVGALPLDPNNPNLSLEERMKIRRMQQLGGAEK